MEIQSKNTDRLCPVRGTMAKERRRNKGDEADVAAPPLGFD